MKVTCAKRPEKAGNPPLILVIRAKKKQPRGEAWVSLGLVWMRKRAKGRGSLGLVVEGLGGCWKHWRFSRWARSLPGWSSAMPWPGCGLLEPRGYVQEGCMESSVEAGGPLGVAFSSPGES